MNPLEISWVHCVADVILAFKLCHSCRILFRLQSGFWSMLFSWSPSHEKEGEKKEKIFTHALLELLIDYLIGSLQHFEVGIFVPTSDQEAEVSGLVCGGAAHEWPSQVWTPALPDPKACNPLTSSRSPSSRPAACVIGSTRFCPSPWHLLLCVASAFQK